MIARCTLHYDYEIKSEMSRLDDIEDGSPLRRSRPATHTVFGIPQTVNSATYQLVDIIGRVRDVGSGELVHIVLGKYLSNHHFASELETLDRMSLCSSRCSDR